MLKSQSTAEAPAAGAAVTGHEPETEYGRGHARMIKIDPEPQSHADNYRLMTGLVVPRPIAWITTLSADGRVNLAPFSAFTFVCHKPPMVTITVGLHEFNRMGELKDTLVNILRDGEYVVNIANRSLLEALHASSAVFPAHVSEVEALGLTTAASATVKVPRLADAPAALECRLHTTLELGEAGDRVVIGRVQMFQVADGLLKNGKVDTRRLDPIARLGGPNYATFGEIVTMPAAEALVPDAH
jgi:flavin reductase (DIM6/NTAB) family NADH-FMN oxidoreductase RutF